MEPVGTRAPITYVMYGACFVWIASRSLIGVFVGELYAATAGIGFMITVAGATFQTDKVFVGILIFIITGLVATDILDRIERRFDEWRPKVGALQ